MSSADEGAAGISASLGDEGAALQRAQDKIATMQARAGTLDELPQSGVPRRRRQRHRRHPAGARRSRVAAEVDKELAALKAEIGPGSSAPPELAGEPRPGAPAGARHPPPTCCRELHPAGSSGGMQISQICVATGIGRSRRLKVPRRHRAPRSRRGLITQRCAYRPNSEMPNQCARYLCDRPGRRTQILPLGLPPCR